MLRVIGSIHTGVGTVCEHRRAGALAGAAHGAAEAILPAAAAVLIAIRRVHAHAVAECEAGRTFASAAHTLLAGGAYEIARAAMSIAAQRVDALAIAEGEALATGAQSIDAGAPAHTGQPARAAMHVVAADRDTGVAALDVAHRAALQAQAAGTNQSRRAGVATGAAVTGARLGVDAVAVAFDGSRGADTRAAGAKFSACALDATASAVFRMREQIDTPAAALCLARRAGRCADARIAERGARADVIARTAVERVAREMNTLAVATGERRLTCARTFDASGIDAATRRAAPAVMRIELQIHAGPAAIALARRTVVLTTALAADLWFRTSQTAATAVLRIVRQRDAAIATTHLPQRTAAFAADAVAAAAASRVASSTVLTIGAEMHAGSRALGKLLVAVAGTGTERANLGLCAAALAVAAMLGIRRKRGAYVTAVDFALGAGEVAEDRVEVERLACKRHRQEHAERSKCCELHGHTSTLSAPSTSGQPYEAVSLPAMRTICRGSSSETCASARSASHGSTR